MKKFMILFLLGLFVLVIFNGCSKVEDFMWDEISPIPIPGNSGLIIASNVSALGVDLHWTKATDDITESTNLEYLVYYSTTTNIDTVSNVEANGVAVGSYTNDINMKSVTGLSENSTYYFTVIVKDEVTNKAAYKVQVVNIPEGGLPIPGNIGVIDIPIVMTSPLVLNWSKALDNVSSQANLEYLVYYSTNANINTVANIEANGIAVGSYEKDIITKNVIGLIKGLTYYFNVVVKDEAGNKACYTVKPGAIYCSISYDGNGNDSGVAPVDVNGYTNGQSVIVVNNSGILEKANNDGISLSLVWNTQVDGNGTNYAPALGTFFMGSADITLYAKWNILRGIGPAGGLVFYDKESYSDGWRYLEAAPLSTEWTSKQFGAYGTSIGTIMNIGSGQANTTAIVTWLDAHGETDRAAQLCDALVEGGYDDWFLPSKDELNKMYLNLQSGTDENSVVYTSVGGFSGRTFWCSSEFGSPYAWLQVFSSGTQGINYENGKSHAAVVRAVRAF